MIKNVFLTLTTCVLISLALTGCQTGITQEDYDSLGRDLQRAQQELAQTQQSLIQAESAISDLQTTLTETQAERDDCKYNPPVLEVDFVDIGAISKLTNLKLSKQNPPGGTYVVECELELTGELVQLSNVIDVELYIQEAFIDSVRWIDVSSTGHITTQSDIRLDTGLEDLTESIKIKIVPSFKVFGT